MLPEAMYVVPIEVFVITPIFYSRTLISFLIITTLPLILLLLFIVSQTQQKTRTAFIWQQTIHLFSQMNTRNKTIDVANFIIGPFQC